MRKLDTGLRVSTFLVVLCGYLGLATTNRYSLGVAAIPVALLALMPLGEWLDGRFARYRTATSFVSIGYVTVSMVLIPFMDLLSNVVNLVIFIQAYSFVHRKQPRDYVHLLLMSFFMLLAASVLMPDPEIGVIMLVFLLGSVAMMVLLQIKTEAAKMPAKGGAANGSAVNGGADILPLDETEPSMAMPRRGFDMGVLNSVSAISAASIVATVLLFIAIPRMEAGLLGRTDPTLFHTDVSQTIDLGQSGPIERTTAAIMRVEFPDEPGGRYNGPMYWRSASLDYYEEPRWQRKGLVANPNLMDYSLSPREILESANRRNRSVSRQRSPGKRLVRQLVYIQEAPEQGVPGLSLVQRMQAPQEQRGVTLMWDRTGDYSVRLNRPGQRWLQYEAASEVEQYTPEQLRAAPDNYRTVMAPRDYEVLTSHSLQQRTLDLARQITEGKTSTYDKVVAIAAYLSQGGYRYTLDVPELPGWRPIDAFIHDVRAGHCELFASALALMVRSLDVPARVVTGYHGAEWSDLDGSYIVRQDMAHLWVEVYFIGAGWVTFDPSPADAQLASLGKNRLLRFMSRQALNAKMLWYRNVVTFNRGAQLAALRNFRGGIIRLREGLFDWGGGRASQFRAGPAFAAMLALLLVFAATISGLVAWAHATGQPRLELTPDQARAVKLYKKLLRELQRAGITCKGLAAEEIHTTIEQTHPHALPHAAIILQTYNEARFGERPLPQKGYRQLLKLMKTANLARLQPR